MYRVNEIFYSLQGEGRWAGRAAVFIRFSGCNLSCPFCDTDFSHSEPMTIEEIIGKITPWKECGFVVLTGGEPTLQVDEVLTAALHSSGFYIAIETNGTHPVARGVDWITVSPKQAFVRGADVAIDKADEVKLVFDGENEPDDLGIAASYYYLQPCDTGDARRNQTIRQQCVEYIKSHPHWQLSLQQHKILDIR